MQPARISLFDYTDFRTFLRDYYSLQKKRTRGFSHRFISGHLGFTSPNFLKLVMDGKRNISKRSLKKITWGLGLNKKETEYFSYLVFFTQARDRVEKNYYFGLIAGMRASKNITVVARDQFEYFSEWYHPIVREIVLGRSEPLDYALLSQCVHQKVSPVRIRKSVDLLKRLGLIRPNAAGAYAHSSPLLNTGNELDSFAVRRYHNEVLNIARQTLDDVEPENREVSHLTVRISPEGFQKIKQRLQELRGELLQTVSEDHAPDGVYHVNFQLYPVAECGHHEAG